MSLSKITLFALVVITVMLSGCCCCSTFRSSDNYMPIDTSNPNDDDPWTVLMGTKTPTPEVQTIGAADLIGEWSWSRSTSYTYSGTDIYAGYSGMGETVTFYKNGSFSDAAVFPMVGGGGPSAVYTGQYRVSGDTIKYTNVVKYNFPDMSKPDYTTQKIADTSGTYRIETGDTYDTIYLQADGLWNNETALYKYH